MARDCSEQVDMKTIDVVRAMLDALPDDDPGHRIGNELIALCMEPDKHCHCQLMYRMGYLNARLEQVRNECRIAQAIGFTEEDLSGAILGIMMSDGFRIISGGHDK